MSKSYPSPWVDDPITRFKGSYYFLSNFYESPIEIEYRGKKYAMPTGEHCFQGMKVAATIWVPEKAEQWLQAVADAPTPSKSKYLGRSIQLDVKKWNAMSFACMQRTQELKYSQNLDLKEKLLATGDRILIEGTDWGDKIWGVDEKGEGMNLLGKILMTLRSRLKVNWLD